MITEKQRADIYNATLVGMAKEDAYILAGLTEKQIVEAEEDYDFQRDIKKWRGELEYSLLDSLQKTIEKQTRMGKESATVWLLEKINPRYTAKSDVSGSIVLNVSGADRADVEEN